jgi:site-specific DNA recombinase
MFGYMTNGTVIVDIDEPEARALRHVFAMRADGASTRAIADYLNREGFRSKRSGNAYIPANVIRGMLRNPVYTGMVKAPSGELIEGKHPAIVSHEIFDAVQATWRRTTALTRTGGRGGSLSGLLVCSGCGRRLTSEGSRYVCKSVEGGHACLSPVAVQARETEEIVEKAFLRRFDPKRMPNRGRVKQTRQQTTWVRKAAQHRQRAEELTIALDTLADQAFIKGTLAADDYQRQQARYLDERARELELAAEMDAAARTVRPLSTSVLDRWSLIGAQAKRRALQLLIDRVDVGPANGRGRHADPLKDRLRISWVG